MTVYSVGSGGSGSTISVTGNATAVPTINLGSTGGLKIFHDSPQGTITVSGGHDVHPLVAEAIKKVDSIMRLKSMSDAAKRSYGMGIIKDTLSVARVAQEMSDYRDYVDTTPLYKVMGDLRNAQYQRSK